MAVAVERAHMADSVLELPLEQLQLPEDNIRAKIGDVSELARSIAAVGMLEPIVVTPRSGDVAVPDGYLVVCGARRVAGASAAGLTHVPAIVREFTDEQRIEAMVVENLQREDLSPTEEAEAFQRLVDLGHSQRQLALRLGRSQSHISKRLALLELPAAAGRLVDSGRIRLEDAAELGKLRDHPERIADVVRAIEKRPQDVEWILRQELSDLEREEKIARTRAELEKSGVTIVELVGEDYNQRPPSGTAIVREYAYDRRQVEMKISKHAKLPCHAVAIDVRGGVFELCTAPAAHKGKNASLPEARTKTELKRKEHEKAIRDARRVRIAFIRGLLEKPPASKDELVETVVLALIAEAWQDKRKVACELLGVDPESEDARAIADAEIYVDRWQAALQLEAKKPRRALTVGLALAISVEEQAIGKAWSGWRSHKGHFAWLERHGYEISPAERAELDGGA